MSVSLLIMSVPDHQDAERSNARAVTLEVLARRAPGATVCPSEVARAIAIAGSLPDWRDEMAAVHAAVDSMLADGLVRLSWKGTAQPVRNGPYRIGRVER